MADRRTIVPKRILGFGLGLVVVAGMSACASKGTSTNPAANPASTTPASVAPATNAPAATTPATAPATTKKAPSGGGISY